MPTEELNDPLKVLMQDVQSHRRLVLLEDGEADWDC
jgi:hypothetical protein